MKYIVLTNYDELELSNEICVWLGHGWVLQGGVASGHEIVPEGYDRVWAQALTHTSDNPEYPGFL